MTLEELLAENGLDPKRASSGRELIVECPFCHRPKLYVNAKTGLWLCYRCEERGNKWSLLEKVVGLNPIEAGYYIRTKLDDTDDTEDGLPEPEVPIKPPWLPTGFVTLPTEQGFPGVLNPLCPSYISYLLKRDITFPLMMRFHIGYAPGNPVYDWRVIIPVIMGGVLQSFVARSIYDACFRCRAAVCECPLGWQRVLYPPGTKMSQLLFNLDAITGNHAVLVEGVFDAMRMPDHAVAAFGSHLSHVQRTLLRSRGVEGVTIMFDGDEPGREAATRVSQELLADLFTVRIAHVPDGRDPGNMTETECVLAIANATPAGLSFSRSI